MKQPARDTQLLIDWFLENQRSLPWRKDQDPYKIWISEVMLQQTTVTAVIPYYEKFLKKFPNIKSLSQSSLEDVFELWAGLGYYSRAKNLHKAAQQIAKLGAFPKTAEELLELPGFGPYTSRAVSSLAFAEKVGVLDGNVIRVLSRKYALMESWWNLLGRKSLQSIADQMAQVGNPADVNQGLMELGATVCTPQNPNCLLCPWNRSCRAREQDLVDQLPLPRPRKAGEFWIWQPQVIIKKNNVAFIENRYAPFLKGQWLFPGEARLLKNKPTRFDFQHGITHHKIFISVNTKAQASEKVRWVALDDLKKVNPSSLVTKVIRFVHDAKDTI